MKRLALLLLLTACDGSGLDPDPTPSLLIELDTTPVDEAALVVGERIQFSVSMRGVNRPVPPSEVTWWSEPSDVASVAANGMVTAEGAGAARVIAVVGALADTVLVTVFPTLPEVAHCDSGAEGLTLRTGESFTTSAAIAAELCLAGGAEYLLVPFNAAESGAALQVRLTSEGVAPPQPPDPSRQPPYQPEPDLRATPRGLDFEAALRARERRDLTPLVTTRGPRGDPAFAASPAGLPTVGQTLELNVNAAQTCTDAVRRHARVVAVTQYAIILDDPANPADGFTDAEYRAFGEAFDLLVYPTIRQYFGEPTDIDGNGRVLILFTRAVNELTSPGSGSYVGGFFFARDLFPKSDADGLRGCGGSNAAEVLYMLVPDPKGEVNGNTRSKRFVSQRTVAILAHELQHLVSTGRRLRVLGLENWSEDFWLNEGLSHIAEELAFYAATSLAPRSGIHYGTLKSSDEIDDRLEQFQMTNFIRLSSYARAPGEASPFFGTELATRGASWSFLRYAADRKGGDEAAFWRTIIDGEAVGYQNLMDALGASPMTWIHDWAVALYVDRITDVPERFRNPSWSYRTILPWVDLNAGVYPLTVRILRTRFDPREASYELGPGGAGFARIVVPATTRAAIRIDSGGALPPASLRLTVVRTR